MGSPPKRYAVLGLFILTGCFLVFSPFAIVDGTVPTATPLGLPTETTRTATAEPSAGRPPTTETGPNVAFREVANEVGFTYTYYRKRDQTYNDNAGVYAADYDKDGWMDLLAVGGEQPVLFRNDRGTFRRSGLLSRVPDSVVVQSALFFDYDGDGWEDLLLLRKHRSPRLLENHRGTFRRVERSGFARPLNNSIGATAGDFDGDGCLDVFVVQYGEFAHRKPMGLDSANVPLPADNGYPNYLYEGSCSSFKRVDTSAIRGAHWTLATSFADLTGDGRPDIHVANDFTNDIVYVNRRNGTFDRHVLDEATDRNAMSSEVADVNRDGRPDIFVTNIWFPGRDRRALGEAETSRYVGSTLLINRGNATFVDRAEQYGVRRGGWGWAAVLGDFDNDMDRDLFHTTLRVPFEGDPTFSAGRADFLTVNYSFYTYPVIAERTSDGFRRRAPYPDAAGFNVTDGRGVARLDFDHDGDLDLAVGTGPLQGEGRFRLYENVGARGNAIRLSVLTVAGAPALGTTVTVTAGNRTRSRWVTARADYFSQDSRTVHVGTGNAERVDITVVWPDGTKRRLTDVAVGRTITLFPNGTVAVRSFEGEQ